MGYAEEQARIYPFKVGDRIGKLVVTGEVWRKPNGKGARTTPYCPCICDCGQLFDAHYFNLKSGFIKSCGCGRSEFSREANITHGDSKSKLYNIWTSMKRRCSCQSVPQYKDYGGRGIHVCDEWRDDYGKFLEWSNRNGYRVGLTLDRIDNDGNYEPGNCRWVTRTIQNRNKSNNRIIQAYGESKTSVEWIEDPRCKVDRGALEGRLKRHWCPEDAISTPLWKRPKIAGAVLKSIAAKSSILSEDEIDREIWKAIPGWAGCEASSVGRIRSYWKMVGSRDFPDNPRRFVIQSEPRIVKPVTDKYGRQMARLNRERGHGVLHYVSRLVLMAHVGIPKDGIQGCHFPDPNPTNCRLTNLRWDTPSGNLRDKTRLNQILLGIICD